MTTIAEVRQQYPQYMDMSDEQLAKALHGKFYSDISYDDFAGRIGLKPVEKAPPVSVGGVAAEAGKGLARGASDTAMMLPQGALNAAFPLMPMIRSAVMDVLKETAAPSRSLVPSNPQNNAERMAATGGEIAGAVAAGGGIGGGLGRTALNIGLPAAGGVAGEQVAGDTGKLVGSLTPVAAQAAGSAVVSRARQALANRMAGNVETFGEAGATPSLGQATEFNFIQGMENLLSKFPGGQGVFRRFAENQQEKIAANAKTGVSAEDAGRTIEEGIKGFVGRTKQVWNRLDDEVATKVGGASAPTAKTAAALDELTKPVAGVDAFVNPKIADIKNTLAANPSFQELRALRSRIGAMLDESLVSGIPGGELKKLYGAMSQDLEAAAKQAGAGKEFARQNEYYAARMDRIEGTLERVLGKTPEETFKRFMPTDPNQVTTVRQVMRSLDPEQRTIVQNAVVERLGRAKSGRQDETGELFSPDTFLTNWNNLSPGARQQIFSDPAVRKNMDAIASITANIRDGAKVFANPSGTAGATAPYGIGYLAAKGAVDVATGNFAGAAVSLGTAGALLGGASIGAKMLTSPKVIDWLANAPKIQPGREAAYIARLGIIYNETKDQALKQELGDYISSVSK